MNKKGRYSTSGFTEDQFEPGSNGQVLKNLLGIITQAEMERIETELLFELTDQLLDECDLNKKFAAEDILQMHHRWLGTVYAWAGHYRQVMMSKGNFPFAAPAYIPKLMTDFERDFLAKYTPCSSSFRPEGCWITIYSTKYRHFHSALCQRWATGKVNLNHKTENM